MKALNALFQRYSGKKFFIFLSSIAVLWFFWDQANQNPDVPRELTATVLLCVAIVSAAASIGQGIHEHGNGKE